MTKSAKNYEIVPYKMPNGNFLEVKKYQSDVWMTTAQIATLYGCTQRNVEMHLAKIYKIGELDKNLTTKKFFANDNNADFSPLKNSLPITHHNRRAVFHVGYRVNGKMGMVFRNWTSDVLEEKLSQGQENCNKVTETEKLQKQERANKIRNLMKLKGISCTKIADDLGISTIMVSYLIHGRHFNIRFENWIEENLFKTPTGIENKINMLVKDVLKGDFEAYAKLMSLFAGIANAYDFKISKVDNWLKENLGI